MKTTPRILTMLVFMLFMFSCDEPVTVVTNFVHPDGSVTRRIVTKYKKKEIEPSLYQVPFDSTWTITTTIEPAEKDTTWIFTAEKEFNSVDEINLSYQADSGANKMILRSASFSRKFMWFNTFYYYSEKVSKVLNTRLTEENIFSQEELKYFHMPSSMLDSLVNSPDSTAYKLIKAKNDSLEDRYLFTALIEEWMLQYLQLRPDSGYIIPLKDKLINQAIENDYNEDSMFIVNIGEEYYSKNKDLIKLAMNEVDTIFNKALNAKFYTCETVMPFNLIATNGFVDSTEKVSWPVDSKYFVSQDYVMWAESKKSNKWAWAITGAFVVFVVVGLILRKIKRNS